MPFKIHNAVRAKYTGLFGFERVMGAHYNALMAAMRHFESVGDDTSLGLVLMALIRGRKPWMMDLRYKYFQSARLERFSEVLIVMFRWVVRNLSVPLDEVRVLLKKLEHHLPHRNKRKKVSEYLYQALEDAGRVADAYDAAHLLMRHDLMGLARKKQMDQAIGRDAADMYRPIDPLAWGRTGRGGRSLLTDADALKTNPADTKIRIHLVELLLANGDGEGALEVSRACELSDVDFDVLAQRLVLLLNDLSRVMDQSAPGPASRKKPKRRATSRGGAAVSTTERPSVTSIIDEVLHCCGAMLSIDPGSNETINLLVKLYHEGLVEGRCAERLAFVLSSAGAIDSIEDDVIRTKLDAINVVNDCI